MKKWRTWSAWGALAAAGGVALAAGAAELDGEATLSRIVFGSCANQNLPMTCWEPVLAERPQLFIFAGDNVYADTYDLAKMRLKYAALGDQPGYRKLKKRCPILATWDDHDYGLNDAGAEYREKAGSREVFFEFFEVPAAAPRRQHAGIYDAVCVGPRGRRVQVILLDTRYNRGPLVKLPARAADGGPYTPNPDPAATLLGPEQWTWLEDQLGQPADLRLIVSSIQVASIDHHWEHWGNFPAERARLLELIRRTRANGVILLSGDRHQAELSCVADGAGYPLLDLTSSGLNNARGHVVDDPNSRRLAGPYFYNNFGVVRIDWRARGGAVVTLAIRDLAGATVFERRVPLASLAAAPLPSP